MNGAAEPSKRPPPQEDIRLQVLRRLQQEPDISQRALARELGISLGSINYCFQALVQKGLVKIQNFQKSNHKLGYMYLLTPAGIAEKSALTAAFLKRKLREYEQLRQEIELLQAEVPAGDLPAAPGQRHDGAQPGAGAER